MTKHQPDPEGDLLKAAIGNREFGIRGGHPANQKFRVPLRVLGVAVVIPMEQTIVFVRQPDRE
jgi:hypothetical protein